MSNVRPRFATLAVLLLMIAQMAGGQGTQSAQNTSAKTEPKEIAERFAGWTVQALLSERDTLNKEIIDLNNNIGWVGDAIVKRADKAQLEAKHKSTEQIDDQINTLLDNAGIPGTALNELDARLGQYRQSLVEKQHQETAVDGELTRRLDLERPKQTFKLEMSAVFAVLVGLVIVGFFLMAYRDEKVRRAIFSHQVGIQFVTLFSLVIAIILFGIIDVLEGKELAALLGGLSGYILGRSTGGSAKEEEGVAPQPQPPAPSADVTHPEPGALQKEPVH